MTFNPSNTSNTAKSCWLEFLPKQLTFYIISLSCSADDRQPIYAYCTLLLLLYFCELVLYSFGIQVITAYYD
jgi:hypothetical protein